MVCFRLSFRLICPPSLSLPHWWYVGSGEPCQLGDRQGVVAYGVLATRPVAYGVLATRPVAYGVLATRPVACCMLATRPVAYGVLATRPVAYGLLATRPVAYGLLATRPVAVCRGRGRRIAAVRGPLSVAVPGRHGDFVQYHPDDGGLDEGERLERPSEVLAPGLPGGHHEPRGVDHLGQDHCVGDRQHRRTVDEDHIEPLAQVVEHSGQPVAAQHSCRVRRTLAGGEYRQPVDSRHRLEHLIQWALAEQYGGQAHLFVQAEEMADPGAAISSA